MGISLGKGGAWQRGDSNLQKDATEQKPNLHVSDTGLGGQYVGQGGRRGVVVGGESDGQWRGHATG